MSTLYTVYISLGGLWRVTEIVPHGVHHHTYVVLWQKKNGMSDGQFAPKLLESLNLPPELHDEGGGGGELLGKINV